MKFILALVLVAIVITCASSKGHSKGHHRGHHKMRNFPNCPHSEFFNNTLKECGEQTFGNNETTGIEPRKLPRDPAKRESMNACVSQKLGFDCEGTITADDVSDIMATFDIASEEIRTAVTTDVANCIAEEQGVGPKIKRCIMKSLEKNCS